MTVLETVFFVYNHWMSLLLMVSLFITLALVSTWLFRLNDILPLLVISYLVYTIYI